MDRYRLNDSFMNSKENKSDDALVKSFVHMANSKGPRIYPCDIL